jgi:hypothetical protein
VVVRGISSRLAQPRWHFNLGLDRAARAVANDAAAILLKAFIAIDRGSVFSG